MIASVCLNPGIDKTVYLDSLALGGTNLISRSLSHPGGKGINTAIATRRLGMESLLLGFLYKENAGFITSILEKEGVENLCETLEGCARVNIKLRVGGRNDITEINEPGNSLPNDEVKRLISSVCEKSAAFELLILTGSLPPGCPDDIYAEIIRGVKIPVILDSVGSALKKGVCAGPAWIKPNLKELEELTGKTLGTLREIKDAAVSCIEMGAKNVLVSLDKNGAIITDGETAYHCEGISAQIGSTVGAGDCMVAGIAHSIAQGCADLREILRFAVAAGTAGIITEGTDLLYKKDFDFFLEKAIIKKI